MKYLKSYNSACLVPMWKRQKELLTLTFQDLNPKNKILLGTKNRVCQIIPSEFKGHSTIRIKLPWKLRGKDVEPDTDLDLMSKKVWWAHLIQFKIQQFYTLPWKFLLYDQPFGFLAKRILFPMTREPETI